MADLNLTDEQIDEAVFRQAWLDVFGPGRRLPSGSVRGAAPTRVFRELMRVARGEGETTKGGPA